MYPFNAARLSPRGKTVLAGFLAGKSEKEIAVALGISQHTVHQYSKHVYVHYRVNSRAELMAKLLGPRVDLQSPELPWSSVAVNDT